VFKGTWIACLVIVALAWPAAAGAAAAGQTPEQFLRGIYAAYTGASDSATGINLSNEATLRKYFEPRLASLMVADMKRAAAAGDVGTLDFDPFINAQDYDIRKPAVIAVSQQTELGAMATVTFTNSGQAQTVKYRLVKNDGQWRVYDISWGTASLRAMFQK
jgi:hypothetical protein